MKTSQKVIIFLLVVAVVVLGYWIYNNQKLPVSQNTPVSPTPQTPQTSTTPRLDVEKILADNPGAGATTEQLRTFSAKVASYAVDTSSVEVSSCLATPVVARVFLNKPLNFENKDLVPHRLVNGTIVINVPANGSYPITPSFPGPGIYGYSCDTKMSGIFLVMP